MQFGIDNPVAYLAEHATQDANRIYHWNTNGQVPFSDMLESAGVDSETVALNAQARSVQVEQQMAEYRMRQPKRVSREERAEMRAAFGSRTTVVNVITGRRIRL